MNKQIEALKLAPEALPCCGFTDASAVKWNPCNQVVQCRNCGQVYTALPPAPYPPPPLPYTPPKQDLPDLIAGALGVSRGTAYDMMREALAEQQEPLTDERILSCPYDNNDMRNAFSEGWLKAEAAHGITKGNT